MRRILLGISGVAIGVLLGSISIAFAAPLTWSNSMTVTASSTTFTIATGSVADQFQVNATSVIVTISATTGGTFTLTATSSDLSISADAGGGTDPTSCTGGVASTTISQSSGSADYTITATGTQCTSGGGGGGGGGNSTTTTAQQTFGVGAGYALGNQPGTASSTTTTTNNNSTGSTAMTSTSTISTSGMSTAQLQALLASLEAQLQQLLAQAASLGVSVSSGSSSNSGTSVATAYVFTRDLQLWDSGADVKALQQALIAANSGPAARMLAAHGASRTFGPLTLRAVEEFQSAHGIRATGYVGAKTRAALQGE